MIIEKKLTNKLTVIGCVFLILGCSESPQEIVQVTTAQQKETVYESTLSQGFDFKRPGIPSFIKELKGISFHEAWGRWTDANSSSVATLVFKNPLPSNFDLEIQANGIGGNVGVPVKIQIGEVTSSFVVKNWPDQSIYIMKFENIKDDSIKFTPPSPFNPAKGNSSQDTRKLGIGLISLKVIEK